MGAAPEPIAEAWVGSGPGRAALAAIELHAPSGDLAPLWPRFLDRPPPRVGAAGLRNLGGVDDGVVAALATGRAILFPHGGPAIVAALLGRLSDAGVRIRAADDLPDPVALFPEAEDRVEAHALAAIARAASPAAIPLLLAQRERWARRGAPASIDDRSRRLRHLLVAPRLALVGLPNAGKSTLTNALAGREVAIASPRAGTTRDYVSTRLVLDGLAVDWFDTPGLRADADPIEREAQRIARTLLASADLVIAVAEPGGRWPEPAELAGRAADLRIGTKADLGAMPGADLRVSAAGGVGLAELARAVRRRFVPDEDLADPQPWIFDDRLVR